MKKLYFVPFFFDSRSNTGVNFEKKDNLKSKELIKDVYLKNCMVALLSARTNNEATDIAFVTNISVPEQYEKILKKYNILVIKADFDCFRFPDSFKWASAFYKINALKHIVDNYEDIYDSVIFTDSDVFCQQSLQNIWNECLTDRILLFDLTESDNNSLYLKFCNEAASFDSALDHIVHYGGEFFAASMNNAKKFVGKCLDIYRHIIKTNLPFTSGDELILSIAATFFNIKNAGAFISRFWTDRFRIVSTRYKFNPVVFLHCPDQKERGFLTLYSYFCRKSCFPKKNTIYSMLKLSRISFKTLLIRFVGIFIKRYRLNSFNE